MTVKLEPQSWFTADLHINHFNVIRYCDRPYDSVEEMNESLIKNWNDKVAPEDTVYFLGDFALNFNRTLETLPKLNFKKLYFINGNHDATHAMHKGHLKTRAKVYAQGRDVEFHEQLIVNNGKREILLCHLPYMDPKAVEEGHDIRYPDWRPVDRGLPQICGHVHDVFKTRGKVLNVGVDVWDMAPVSLEQVNEIIGGF